uniref:C-type lectin domain-containing protein n=2 Tax=Nothobranchius furzeri TaxID=105023 RepID=A0A8C6MKR9_NOTFU
VSGLLPEHGLSGRSCLCSHLCSCMFEKERLQTLHVLCVFSDPGFDRDSVSSVSEALKQLSALDTISRTVAALKCTIERRLNNGTHTPDLMLPSDLSQMLSSLSSCVSGSMSAGCCPLGWEMLESSCYYFSKIPLSWHEARDWCNGHESHLVILMRDEEWDFVTRMAGGTFFWVGLTDEKSGRWEWVNQTPYVMDRRRWRPGQPDSWTHHGLGPGDEDCAHLHYEGQLNDLHCSTRLRYICQRHSQRT